MSTRYKKSLRTLNSGVVIVAGSFAPNGSSAISASSRLGRGFSVARTSAGLFTITFSDKYNQLLSFVSSLQEATAGDQVLVNGVYTAASKTITITNWDISDAAAADIAANANNRIHFVAVFQDSAVTPSYGT